jgi:pantoate--beta-alanine ligase
MKEVDRLLDLRASVLEARRAERLIGLVPTMGALHAGHLSLIEASQRDKAYTVVSIYVNPTQFGPGEDFQQYPRTLEADRKACADAGIDLLIVPTDAELYPLGDQTRVRPGPLADKLCGLFRPGHFEGVCTVVAKLLNIVQPDVAYFGQKDAQQAVIVRRMIEDLHFGTRIKVCPIVREHDGLAMSSRNVRLSPAERVQAVCLYRALCTAKDRLLSGEKSIGRIAAAMRAVIAEYPEIKVDYLSIVDPSTLEPIQKPGGTMLVAGAIRAGQTRLIDNVIVVMTK